MAHLYGFQCRAYFISTNERGYLKSASRHFIGRMGIEL